MKHNLLVIVMAFVGLLCSAWEEAAAAPTPLACTFTGTINNQATTWEVMFPGFMTYGGVIGSPMYGVNWGTNAGLNGSAYLYGGFPLIITWTEFQTSTLAFTRFVSVRLGPNLQGTGTVNDLSPQGIFTGPVVVSSTSCTGQ